jgi:hypothetical protein
MRLWPFPSISFPSYYSLIIPSFNAVQSDLLMASLNKPQIIFIVILSAIDILYMYVCAYKLECFALSHKLFRSFWIPYLRVYKPHFFDNNLPSKIGVRFMHGIFFLLTTEPATPVLYVVKLPVETVSVWDCYLASYCTHANVPVYYWCIGIFWLHESSGHHQFPEVGRLWQITVKAASDNQSATNAIANILLSHR